MALKKFANNFGHAVATAAARKMMKGLVESYAEKWDFESVYALMSRNGGVNELFPVEYLGVLREQGRRFHELRDNFELKEFLEWIHDGNALLFTQVVENPEIMRWLSQGWEQGRRTLFTEPPS